jgi:hypothetical protein
MTIFFIGSINVDPWRYLQVEQLLPEQPEQELPPEEPAEPNGDPAPAVLKEQQESSLSHFEEPHAGQGTWSSLPNTSSSKSSPHWGH